MKIVIDLFYTRSFHGTEFASDSAKIWGGGITPSALNPDPGLHRP